MTFPVPATRVSFQYGQHEVVLETGHMARQATAAVVVSIAETVVLVSVVAKKEAKEGQDFFPLTVDYMERFYAGGRIPGGFFKREGRQTENETLTSRLIDRPLRPLFPEGFYNEIQVVATVLSLNPQVSGDIAALIGASAAMSLSGVPFQGPIGAARVGYANGQYILNPTVAQLETSKLDLVVAGTKDAVLMVESEAQQLSEEVMLGAVLFGHEQMQAAITAINQLVATAGKPKWEWSAPAEPAALTAAMEAAEADVAAAYLITDKMARQIAVGAVKKRLTEQLASGDAPQFSAGKVKDAFGNLEAKVVRNRILDGQPRIDGRDRTTVRGLTMGTSILPRVHGSSVFTRGETQVVAAVTLGTGKDNQLIDAASGESKDTFLFNYNFPPYCVGETGRLNAPKRREIGHGRLAKRGLLAVMPDLDREFPYVVRVVTEVMANSLRCGSPCLAWDDLWKSSRMVAPTTVEGS